MSHPTPADIPRLPLPETTGDERVDEAVTRLDQSDPADLDATLAAGEHLHSVLTDRLAASSE